MPLAERGAVAVVAQRGGGGDCGGGGGGGAGCDAMRTGRPPLRVSVSVRAREACVRAGAPVCLDGPAGNVGGAR